MLDMRRPSLCFLRLVSGFSLANHPFHVHPRRYLEGICSFRNGLGVPSVLVGFGHTQNADVEREIP